VETGTADGSTVAALVEHFDRLVSIELDPAHYMNDICRFLHEPKVTIVYGDSDPVLARLAPLLPHPALWWMDAHYNGEARGAEETPIRSELAHIFYSRPPGDVVLIDDARMFGAHREYPTMKWIENFVADHTPGYGWTVRDDIIWLLPSWHHDQGDIRLDWPPEAR